VKYFCILAADKPNHGDVRAANRQAHLDYLKRQDHPVTVLSAGPTVEGPAETMTGSLLLVAADSQADVEAFLAADPYGRAGLFQSVIIRQWKWTIGRPDGA